MTVYDYIKLNECDYDMYDDEFDICVTCCDCDEDGHDADDEYYYKFYVGLMKLANIIKTKNRNVVADWSAMVRKNKPVLEEFMKKNWIRQYEDEDDFIWEWIREFHYWGAGYTSEPVYKDFVENYMSRMTRCEREDE